MELLNCNATCDTRMRTSFEVARGRDGVGWDVVSDSEVWAGPRLWRSQACIVGGREGNAISRADQGGKLVGRKLVKKCFLNGGGG